MARAHKRGSAGRRLGRFGRPLLAAGLLAALGWAAVQGVERSSDASDSGRRADRLQVVRAAASSASPWLQAGLDEAQAVAAMTRSSGAGAAVEAYGRGAHRFLEALVVDRNLGVVAGSARFANSDGTLLPCVRAGVPPDDGLVQFVRTASQAGVPSLQGFDDPTCRPVVGAAAAAGNGLEAIVLGDPATLAARLDTLARLPNGQAFFLGPAGATIGADGTVSPSAGSSPDDPASYLASRRQQEGVATVGGIVRAWVPLPGGWTLVADQGASDFLGATAPQPSLWIPAAVAACFALGILVIGSLDARRRKALMRAEEVRASFLAVVSHELRTPLTVLKGFVDTLVARWGSLQDEQRQQLVERLSPQVRRLHRGVDRLLIAADIQRGANLRLNSDQLVLADVVADVVDGFRPLAPLHTFTVDVAPEITVIGDDKALSQALDQIVDNAVKYSPAGGDVAVRVRLRGRRAELTVDDEGVGLPSDYSRIFEPLTQGEEVDGRVHDEGGVGVGLYIARAMVEAMGGSVRAERRTPEVGTRIVVTIVAGPLRTQGREHLARQARVHGPS